MAAAMRDTLLANLRCPKSHQSLTLQNPTRDGDDVLEATLVTSHTQWPVVRSIPRFVPADNYADSFGFQWNRFPGTQLDSVSGMTVSRDRFLAQWALPASWFEGRRILDVGCGAGRFAEIALSLGAEVFAVDLSSAIDACYRNLAKHPKLHCIQASIYDLPFEPKSFDAAYSFGVIQHTPDVRASFHALASMVRPGGEFAVDVYTSSWRGWLHPKPWLRPITRRMNAQKLFSAIETATPALLAASRVLGSVPLVGRVLKRAVPVADYDGVIPVDERQRHEWAVLDTFDWLSPTYDQPQTADTLRTWARECGLVDVHTHSPAHLTLRARTAG
jgi:2-polyprenyl-3-methyl-5-hydroxy-6-metoxy-1,4-benzoquinol methylase